jgi:hypothetical protein
LDGATFLAGIKIKAAVTKELNARFIPKREPFLSFLFAIPFLNPTSQASALPPTRKEEEGGTTEKSEGLGHGDEFIKH